MPRFLDHHKSAGTPPPEMVRQVAALIKSGQADPATGVKGINWFWNDKEQWCVAEAPNAQAVHKYHEAVGVKLGSGDVIEVHSAV